MTVKELYEAIGGNYEEATMRLMNDTLIGKFIVKLPEGDTFDQLVEAFEGGRDQEAFEAAHALKGVCGNLSVTSLSNLINPLTEGLRPGGKVEMSREEMTELMDQLKQLYPDIVSKIRSFQEQ